MIGRIVSVQGTVEVRRAGQSHWIRITRLDAPLCQGDWLRTAPRSRAALVILPEKFVRVDQSSTLSVSITGEETVVEFLQSSAETTPLEGASCGAGYFITRFPRKFKVHTPYLNAAVEGTEFFVGLSCQATMLAVLEGKVRADTPASTQPLLVNTGETVSASPQQASTIRVWAKPVDAVQWALYYPPVGGTGAVQPACDQNVPVEKAGCLLVQAEHSLRLGRVDEAQSDIEQSLQLNSDSGEGYALLAVIDVAKNDKAGALASAQRATRLAPNSARAWIALSYAQQASFQLENALTSADQAAQLEPANSTAQTRVAELLMSLGRLRAAERAARAAVAANPSESRAHTILGFAHLAQIDMKTAREDFLAAIERDSSDPLPRLGLGLTMIRQGQLVAGREQIEIAVMLDPTNSQLRSYAGKAYYEERTAKRDHLAAVQFGLAKQLDPKDPTPWFYDALLQQSQNRPIEALQSFDKSIELNDNRAVYRSSLLLDADRAAREASLGGLYNDLGLQQLGTVAASRALQADPTNYSAHRLLSDIYADLPRYDVARLSEQLQAQLLQPISLAPLQPSLQVRDLNILRSSGPAQASFDDFGSLFERNQTSLTAQALAGTNNTISDELVATIVHDRFAASIGQFYYETDGFRPNNDQRHEIYDALAQVAWTESLSAQVELRRRQTSEGDLRMDFDPTNFSLTDRTRIDHDLGRIGFRFGLAPDTAVLLSATYHDRLEQQHVEDASSIQNNQTRDHGYQVESQLIQRRGKSSLLVGVGSYDISTRNDFNVDLTPAFGGVCPFGPGQCTVISGEQLARRRQNGYVYFSSPLPKSVLWTFGGSVEHYQDGSFARDVVNPKIGLVWDATSQLQVRAAAFRSVKPALVVDQTLEPTQVSGFNQFFDDFNGTLAERYNLGVDWKPAPSIRTGVAGSIGHIERPVQNADTTLAFDESFGERKLSAYAFWSPAKRWALIGNLELENLDRSGMSLGDDPITLRTLLFPVSVRYFAPSGVFASLGTTYVHQTVERLPGSTLASGTSEFSVVDAAIGYRLPARYGLVSLEVKNVFDRSFSYQDLNFQTSQAQSPRFLPTRTIQLRVALHF
jgi:Flp pilus assembly protein TadD